MTETVTPQNWLVFIDTNIFLDFYRVGGEAAARQLAAVDRHRSSIVTGNQIRMEFYKNRQKVLLDSLAKMQKPNKLSVPPILADYGPARNMASSIDLSVRQHAEVRGRLEQILSSPAAHDPVYKSLRKLFEAPGALNLHAQHPDLNAVVDRARRRFSLGYPPRKSTDTSFGDGVNWEWLVDCAIKAPSSPNVLIVSRDGDYGVTVGDATVLNDWLQVEFAERVGPKRKIELTPRLWTALSRLDERVTPEDERDETRLLAELAALASISEHRRGVASEPGSPPSWFSELQSEVRAIQDQASDQMGVK